MKMIKHWYLVDIPEKRLQLLFKSVIAQWLATSSRKNWHNIFKKLNLFQWYLNEIHADIWSLSLSWIALFCRHSTNNKLSYSFHFLWQFIKVLISIRYKCFSLRSIIICNLSSLYDKMAFLEQIVSVLWWK